MTDPILTPEVYGPGTLGEAKAAADSADGARERDFLRRAHRAQNMLRIMFSLDEVARVLPDTESAARFHRDPAGMAIRMDEETWAKVYALIEARQK